MDEQTIRAQLARLEQLRARRGQWDTELQAEQQRLIEQERLKQELETRAQEWRALLAPDDLRAALARNESRADLVRHHAALVSELEQWQADESTPPFTEIAQSEAAITQANMRLERLQHLAALLTRAEHMGQRLTALEKQRAFANDVAAQTQAWQEERQTIPESVRLHTELLPLEQELQGRHRLRATIADTARGLSEALPNHSGDWIAMAFAEEDDLYVQLGDGIQRLEQQAAQATQLTQEMEQRAAARDLEIASLRARTRALEEMEQQQHTAFPNESQEIQEWSKALTKVQISAPAASGEPLVAFWQDLQAKYQALAWFDQTAQ